MNCPASLLGVRLLILEDEAVIAMALSMMLSDLGAKVIAMGGSVSRGLALLADSALELDAAIVDVNLGVERSYPVADLLLAKGIPFIFSTGYRADSVLPAYSQVPTLTKPFDEHSLQATLLRALAAKVADAPAG